MMRYRTIAILAFVALAASFTQTGGAKEKAKAKDFEVKGKLTNDDPRDQQRGGPVHVHSVAMKAGKLYTIDMVSSDFDSYLRLFDPKDTTQLEEDDDGGEGLNSRIIFNCTKDGEYKIHCTTFGAKAAGNYSLTVKITGGAQAVSTAHARMIGQDAPEFTGDFAVNGKPVALEDFKGKVVLLHFWEVRCGSSVALMPRIAEWNKAYKSKGLATVSLTFYASDIGQNLAFNKETGEIKTAARADRKSDQALLREFADHHKVDHLLMALSRNDALDVFNAYYVNGLPQLVVIDRKGIVRLIDINGEKGIAQVEVELKKLLAEK